MPSFHIYLRHSFMQMSVPARILFVLLLVLFFLIVGWAVALLMSAPLFNHSINDILNSIANPDAENINIIKFFQIIQSVFLFIVPSLLAAWLLSENTFKFLKTDKKASVITLVLVLLSLIAAIPSLNVVTFINSKLDLPLWLDGLETKMKVMEDNAGRLTELFVTSNSYTTLAINFIMIAILPAIGEEFLFRGVLQRLFSEWTKNSHAGIIITAFVFSFVHFQFYGFVPRFLLGLYFGYLMLWSSSIWVPVMAHLINNGIAVIYYPFAKDPMGETALDKIGTEQTGNYIIYLSVLVTSVILMLIYWYERKRKVLKG